MLDESIRGDVPGAFVGAAIASDNVGDDVACVAVLWEMES